MRDEVQRCRDGHAPLLRARRRASLHEGMAHPCGCRFRERAGSARAGDRLRAGDGRGAVCQSRAQIYTGVDLTDAAVDLARKRFELFDLPGEFRTADAENLDFADESFDLVYSHGVLASHAGHSARRQRSPSRAATRAGAPSSCSIIATLITIASISACCAARARTCSKAKRA